MVKENRLFFHHGWCLCVCSITLVFFPPHMSDPNRLLLKQTLRSFPELRSSLSNELLSVPRDMWIGRDTLGISDDTLIKKPGTAIVLVQQDEASAIEAILSISEASTAIQHAGHDPELKARIVHDGVRLLWSEDEASTRLEESSGMPPLPTATYADYERLLADARLLLVVARYPYNLPPTTFLSDVTTRWDTNPAWKQLRLGLQREHITMGLADDVWLQTEYLLAHLQQNVAVDVRLRDLASAPRRHRQPPPMVEIPALEWAAASCAVPWGGDIGVNRSNRDAVDLWVLPYRHLRALDEMRPPQTSTPAPIHYPSIDTALEQADPGLRAVVQAKTNEARAKGQLRGEKLDTADRVIARCRGVRAGIGRLADIEDHLPPCVTRARDRGRETGTLKYADRFYTAVFFQSLGQSRANEKNGGCLPVEEVAQFMTRRSSSANKDYADTLNQMLPGRPHNVVGCRTLRNERGKPGTNVDESAIACPFAQNGSCLNAAGLKSVNEPLIYPAQFTMISLHEHGLI